MSSEQDIKAARETYSGFLSLFKLGAIITVLVTAFVVLLLAS
ncbi:aa3-type cytochrome c oxidase subunit IV [Sphingopyxis flava]|uniref:Aa3 type cytochrome c oxidase subunit IV n=1 Tax=Sphingopyxis flava TaxID=1507287 RepID=A0A1T5D927_9SPHN|nr:aa3-type cytochrome c oxidase subunit IV [Sphingopyxis flava]SKB68111.1 aa3 type cytochrome c oxidase subunit IV [Sphingopyxis flava]